MGLKFVVITSPARDDLVDGGAEQFYKVTRDIIEKSPDTKVEILIPDFSISPIVTGKQIGRAHV